MTDVAASEPPDRGVPEFDAADYAAFIGQIELVGVWLASSRIVNHVGAHQPIQAEVAVDSRADWETRPAGFEAEHAYRVVVNGERGPALEIDAAFRLAFSSIRPMTADLFQVFGEANLPLNTWPYLREYVASVFGRVGWVPFTLPTLKRGVAPSVPDDAPLAKKPRRARAAKSPS
jgi:hypothetical protein